MLCATATTSPSARKPTPVSTTVSSGLEALGDFDAVALAAAGLDLRQRDPVVGAELEKVGEAVAHQHAGRRHGQRLAAAEVEAAAREHAGAHARRRRRRCRRRPCPCGSADRWSAQPCAPCRSTVEPSGSASSHRLAFAHPEQLGARHLGAPLQPPLADQAKQFLADPRQRARGCGAHRDHAVVGRDHAGLAQAQLLGLDPRLRRLHARPRGLLGGQVLADLLGADRPGILQLAGPRGIGGRLGQRGPRLRQRRLSAAPGRWPPRCVLSVASTWPLVTRSPTFTSTSAIRKPPTSGLIDTSCQAATLPSASSRVCHS